MEDVNNTDNLALRIPTLSWCGSSILDDYLCTCMKRLVS